MVEKEFVQGKDVSKYDAWKLILLSDLFPKVKKALWKMAMAYPLKPFKQGTTAFEDIAKGDESSEDDEDEEDDEHETTLTEEEEEEIV